MSTPVSERIAHLALERIDAGQLLLRSRDGARRRFAGKIRGPKAEVELRNARAARRVITRGAIGMAEGYIAGDWDTPDLDAVLELGVANLDPDPDAPPVPAIPLARAWHALRDNTVAGSRRNIRYHYDLGNDFYKLWLDETMTYSSAVFDGSGPEGEAPAEPLSQGQIRKWDRLLELLQPSRKDHLLEIGSGWGGFAMHAAQESGCHVTGVTLSEEQHRWATRAVRDAGLEGRVDLRRQDYRHVRGQFSAIASIEMFEAVGARWWPVFFRRMKELLAAGGAAAVQVITIDDRRFERYRRNPDFTQLYIFPGGMLPSPERFAEAARAQGLACGQPRFFGESYARTLAEWRRRFEAALPDVRALGFDERFIRMWRYYLAYCRAGFLGNTIDVMQVRLDS